MDEAKIALLLAKARLMNAQAKAKELENEITQRRIDEMDQGTAADDEWGNLEPWQKKVLDEDV